MATVTIKLPQAILSNRIFNEGEICRLYLYLLSQADADGIVEIGIRTIAKDLYTSYQRVRTMLDKLKSERLITQQSTQLLTQKITQITICQIDVKGTTPTQRATQKATQQSTQSCEPKRFTPPNEAEAQKYIEDMGFHWGCANDFIDHYQARGWKLNGQPMKDWKAAMRTWERHWREKYGVQKNRPIDTERAQRIAEHNEMFGRLFGANEQP